MASDTSCNSYTLFWHGLYSRCVFITHKYSTLQLSSTTGSPSTLNTTSALIVVLQQLHYSHASQQSPTRLQYTSIHSHLQDRTLQQSILLPTKTERMTAPCSDVFPLLVQTWVTEQLLRTGRQQYPLLWKQLQFITIIFQHNNEVLLLWKCQASAMSHYYLHYAWLVSLVCECLSFKCCNLLTPMLFPF
jgi:hypothetical protein